jgi:hypothetical protein
MLTYTPNLANPLFKIRIPAYICTEIGIRVVLGHRNPKEFQPKVFWIGYFLGNTFKLLGFLGQCLNSLWVGFGFLGIWVGTPKKSLF